MTARAAIKQADLRRIASIAKEEGVTVEFDLDRRVLRVSPDIQSGKKDKPIAPVGGIRL